MKRKLKKNTAKEAYYKWNHERAKVAEAAAIIDLIETIRTEIGKNQEGSLNTYSDNKLLAKNVHDE